MLFYLYVHICKYRGLVVMYTINLYGKNTENICYISQDNGL